MEMPERAHLRLSVPAGRLAALKARKMVLPGDCHCPLQLYRLSGLTCLHAHEDAPGIVRACIDQAGDEAADKQWKVGVLDAD